MPSTLFIIKWSDEMFNRVKQIIEEKIKPKLNKSYGDIELLQIEDGIVEIKLLGACSELPFSEVYYC